MIKLRLLALLLVAGSACTSSPPVDPELVVDPASELEPTPDPTPTCTCEPGGDRLCGEPERRPGEKPPSNCYVTVERAGELPKLKPGSSGFATTGSGVIRELWFNAQVLIWDGARNPLYAWGVGACRDAVEAEYGIRPDALRAFALRGLDLYDNQNGNSQGYNARYFLGRLQEYHPRHAGRTRVYKFKFRAFRSELAEHLETAERLNGLRAWCESKRIRKLEAELALNERGL